MIGPELIDLIATETQWPRTDIAMRARYLTAAGLLPKGGRGRNAPHLDEHHVAALLIGVMADCVQAAAVESVRAINGAGRIDIIASDSKAPIICGTFLEAIAQIISMYRRGEALEIDGKDINRIGVITGGGVSRGAIEFDVVESGNRGWTRYTFDGKSLPGEGGDPKLMYRQTWIPITTLHAIALRMGASS